jgi:hypothetical protein
MTNILAQLFSTLSPPADWLKNELRGYVVGWASQFWGVKPNHGQTPLVRQYFGGANVGS